MSLKSSGEKMATTPLERRVLVQLGSRGDSYNEELCPCLMHEVKPIWITNRGRELNLNEKMRLMGLVPDKLKLAVSKSKFARQLGNSMASNVLERLLCRVLPAMGLSGPLPDRWADGSRYRQLAASAQK